MSYESWLYTSKCGHESLHSAGSGSEDEVAVDSRCDSDGESKAAHDESSHSQVDQDVVQRLPEFLVLSRDQQCQTVDGGPSADQEEHVESQKLEHDGICQIILWVFKRTSNNPSPVGHGDVEVLAFCAIGLDSSFPHHLQLPSLLELQLMDSDKGMSGHHWCKPTPTAYAAGGWFIPSVVYPQNGKDYRLQGDCEEVDSSGPKDNWL